MVAATTPYLLPDRVVAASTAPSLGLLPDLAGSGSREFRSMAATGERQGVSVYLVYNYCIFLAQMDVVSY